MKWRNEKMRYAKGFKTRKQAINSVKKNKRSMAIVKLRGYFFGMRGGKVPVKQARLTALKINGRYYPTAKRKK